MKGTEQTRQAFAGKLTEVRAMRDELKVRLHLASLEGKERWKELGSELEALEQRLERSRGTVVESAENVLLEIEAGFRKLRERIAEKR